MAETMQYEELLKKYEELTEKYERVRSNEEMYRVALGLTDHTISVVDIEKHTLNQIYNEGDWTGVAVSMENAPESIISTGIIHPDDCEGYREFYKRIYAGDPRGSYTMRVMEENRGWVWFTMLYQTTFDKETGKPLRAICFSDDITVRKKAEEKYEQYKTAVTAEADFIWEANLTQDILISNDTSFGTVFQDEDYQQYSAIANSAIAAVEDPLQKELVRQVFGREQLLEAFAAARREVALDYQFDYHDGRGMRWLHSVAYLMTNNVEDVTTIICVKDITEQRKELEMLEMKAERDALTGLYNRASFQKSVGQVLSSYQNRVHGLLMIDVDDFKNCNDTYGHAYGDEVLRMISNVLQRTFRVGDFLGRMGGDEFMVFMRDAGDAAAVVERAQDLQRQMMEACRQQKMASNVTISVGVTISKLGDDFDSLYSRADEAMYRGKRSGKNCLNIS